MSNFIHIQLTQFRNYGHADFGFDHRVVGICGPNGSGKTNLLDALYYLCFTRSYFSKPDTKNAQHGTMGFRLEGKVNNNSSKKASDIDTLLCIIRETGKKEFLLNEEPYLKFSEHIGRYPCVMIAPDDAELITGGSEERRKFIDTILSQTTPDYLRHLIAYNKVLAQRNALLKNGFEGRNTEAVLTILDRQLAVEGQPIFALRQQFLLDFLPEVIQQYEGVAGKPENVTLDYQSPLMNGPLESLLKASREKDFYRQRTTAGIHKDELNIQLDGQPFKQLASQGQRKSLLFALKLAEYYFIARVKSRPPILLLDDVFEKLDATRMLNLLEKVCGQLKGQVFITDTHADRLRSALEALGQAHQMIELGG